MVQENGLIANYRKSQFLISPYETKSMRIQNLCVKASFSTELLGKKINSNLTVQKLIKNLVLYPE